MDIVISDLDGTLLDHESYSFEEALPGIELLRRRSIPLVLCTSKTRSEVEYWRDRIGNAAPFIVENGGALYALHEVPLGAGYGELVEALREASARSGCRVRGFHDMTVAEVGLACGLEPGIAALAKKREFDEPFLALDPDREPSLLRAIEATGKRWTRGGRFHHIMGHDGKGAAVQKLTDRYRRSDPQLRTVGLGDGLNDAEFLTVVDVPILIRSPWLDRLQAAVPRGTPTRLPGPRGWNQAITALFS